MANPFPKERQLFTEIETAEILNLKPQTLAAWRCRGANGLPFVKLGRAVRYRRADIEEFIERNTSICASS